jgi:glycosyltransferase involved in cell wall biosynthesis
MTAATVLIPTHSHVEPLRHAVASVQQQGLRDFELFIVGDGVTDATRAGFR